MKKLTACTLIWVVAACVQARGALTAPGTHLQTFTKPPPTNFARFGQGVAAVGDTILIGGENAGEAYLFDVDSGSVLRTLPSPVPGGNDGFGFSAAGTATNAFVGAVIDSSVVNRAGAVYAFNPTDGSLIRTFRSPTPISGGRFGYSIAASGNKLLVGQNEVSAPAYLFNSDTGDLLLTIPNPVPGVINNFGKSVAFFGNNLLIGAPADELGSRIGAAYLFDGTTGNLLRTFKAPPISGTSNRFGYAVTGWGSNVLIGAPFDDALGSNRGAAYVFNAATGAMVDTYYNPEAGPRFGSSVATLRDQALIGSESYKVVNDGGAVFGFNSSHKVVLTATNPRPEASTNFSYTPLGIVGSKFVVGAWGDDSTGITAGIAYSFEGPALLGDFDLDDDVDGADFCTWQANFPKSSGATLAEGDGDRDGDVDGADFVLWQTHFPVSSGIGLVPVPELASFHYALLAVPPGYCFWLRRRRQ